MKLKKQIKDVILKINSLHPEDPKVYEYWEQMTAYLVRNTEATITLIDSINDQVFAEDLSSVFDDVATTLQSEDFIKSIERLSERCPEANLSNMINAAKNNMN